MTKEESDTLYDEGWLRGEDDARNDEPQRFDRGIVTTLTDETTYECGYMSGFESVAESGYGR